LSNAAETDLTIGEPIRVVEESGQTYELYRVAGRFKSRPRSRSTVTSSPYWSRTCCRWHCWQRSPTSRSFFPTVKLESALPLP
jgi:hypothetical protein